MTDPTPTALTVRNLNVRLRCLLQYRRVRRQCSLLRLGTAATNRLSQVNTVLLTGAVFLVAAGAVHLWWPYHREQQAVAEVLRLGGRIDTVVVRPDWMPDAIGDDYLVPFRRVIRVQFDNTAVQDGDLKHLRPLEYLQSVSLLRTQIGDAGLAHLSHLTRLKGLNLSFTRVTDAGMRCLSGLTGLRYLVLDHTAVSDIGLVYLRDLRRLGVISVEMTHVSVAGLTRFQSTLDLFDPPAPHTPATEAANDRRTTKNTTAGM